MDTNSALDADTMRDLALPEAMARHFLRVRDYEKARYWSNKAAALYRAQSKQSQIGA